MKGLLILVLFGAQVLTISGFGSRKPGRCTNPKENVDCRVRIKQCLTDIECSGIKKCCDDGCGGFTCRTAKLPPRPVQALCSVDSAVKQRNNENPICQRKETKFCYKTNCERCCSTTSTCNPNPSLYMSVDECTKVLCARKTCYTQGEICVMDQKFNNAKCECPRGCGPARKDEAVCGTDKITYSSRCEMNLTACVIGHIIGVAYPGECRRGQNIVTVSPSHVKNQVLKTGKRGKITCQFEGDPVQIIWDKAGLERLPPSRMLPQDNVLVIKTVIKSDAGVYMCNAFDGVRAVVGSVNVSVQEPKIITLKAIKPRSVCLQNKLIGTGRKYVVRFFFNSATRLCEPFVYSGDGGNENNFLNIESCKRACFHSATDICSLPKMPGPCMARFEKWYYDSRKAKCKMFVYGGCLGNANQFDSKKACLRTCSAKHVCTLPKAIGSCNGHTARYYFDAASKSCKKFIYSGCHGNANRFHSKKRCERKCKRKAVRLGARVTVKPGVCQAPRFDVGSCSDHSRDSCMTDMDCKGRNKCCFDGCHRSCSEPLKKARFQGLTKLGLCPAPKFRKEVCANKYQSDVCQADHECPGMHKCCHNGCYNDCSLPKKMPNGRPKPGICPVAVSNVLSCKTTRHECSRDNDCFGRQKCCNNGCHRECMAVAVYKPKPGQCPIQDSIEDEDCSDAQDDCSYDNECSGASKCCFTGCKMECLSPPGIKPGVCPKSWKGLNGICDLRGDMCSVDNDCNGDTKCCHNGCQKECVSPKGKIEKDKKPIGRCPKPWKNSRFCDRMGDRCNTDKDCYGNFRCCFNGCQKDCVQPVNLTSCQEEKQRAMDLLSDELPPIGIFVPRCTPDGSYQKVQCSGSVGQCWCVEENGTEIAGTRARTTKPNCDVEVPKEREGRCPAAWKGSQGFCDFRGDACDNDNNCPFTQKCCNNGCQRDCVYPDGMSPCQKHRMSANSSSLLGMVGHFTPKCRADGFYDSIQCHGSTGYCWCVDIYGNELPDTRKRGRPDCNNPDVSGSGVGVPGRCPDPTKGKNGTCDRMGDECTIDSTCSGASQKCCFNGCQRQCLEAVPLPTVSIEREGRCPAAWKGSQGFCDFRGDTCDNDNKCPFTQKCCNNGCQRDCVYPDGMSPCQKHRMSANSSSLLGMVGHFTPKCRADGFYDSIQCHGSTGYCWCVDIYGNELPDTRKRGRPDCNNPDVSGSGVGVPGRCPDPTKGKNGTCDRMGDECTIDSTCSGASQKCCFNGCQRQCLEAVPLPTERVLTTCQKKLNSANGPFGVAPPGAFVPSCKPDGRFNETQCHESVGECWCVHGKTGEEIVSTRISRREGEPLPVCSDAGLTKCQRHYRDSLDHPRVGGFQPSCEDSGKYESMQCYGSTGYCWCVDEEGTELTGTRIRGRPDCKPKLDPCAGVRCPYYGRCVASKEGSTSCVCSTFCTLEWMPFCGSDGKTYGNECEMKSTICSSKKMITIASRGDCLPADDNSCDSSIKCSHPLQSCFMRNSTPVCECPLVKCSSQRKPVCGTDNKTYNNKCIMDVHACQNSLDIKVAHEGECKGNVSDPCSISLCSHPQHTCQNINNKAVCKCREVTTLELDPKCASDGKTYANRMSMENAGCKKNMILQVVKNGKCEAIEKPGRCPALWDVSGTCESHANTCEDDGSCNGTMKCCYSGCQRVCVHTADFLTCHEKCGRHKTCVGFADGTTRCVCEKGTIMEGNTCKRPGQVTPPPPIDPCEISLCSFPHSKCRVVNDTATCECPKYCTRELVPVCGSDGKTYDNMCLLEVEACKPENTDKLLLKHQGDCKRPHDICETTLCSHPLQKCVNKNGEVTCECPLICPAIYAPVCGSDGKTYPSNCSLSVEGCRKSQNIKVVSQGPCPENLSVKSDPCSISLCSHPQHTCQNINNTAVCKCREVTTLEINPKCASDGKTYANRMSMENAGCKKNMILKVVKNGRCDAVTRAGTCPAPWTGLNGLCNRRGSMCDGDSDCAGASKCCYNGCQRDCVNVADNIKCDEVCGENEQCVGFRDGSTRCLCRNNTVMNMDGTCTSVINKTDIGKPIDPCEISLCSFPHSKCRVVNDTATCECPKYCTRELVPVCGSDGETYDNMCLLEVEACKPENTDKLLLKHQGDCKKPHDICETTLCSHPLQKCVNKDGEVTCECPLICPAIFAPVCGSDGKTYPNNCSLSVEGCRKSQNIKVVSQGPCPENLSVKSDPCSISLCSHPQHTCQNINNTAVCKCREVTTLELDPKCASDGKTYANRMSMENAGCKKNMILKVVKNGRCDAVTRAGTCPAPWTGLNGLCNRRGSMCGGDSDCTGASKCCYNGCQRDCVNVADNIKCDEVCGENEQCVGFPGGSTRCLCRNNTVMNMDGTCTSVINKTDIGKPIDPCEISLCSFPHSKCRVVNDTATCECPKYCTRELVPVCGSDGKTYDNMCLLEVEACKPENTDKLLLKHQGDCKKPHDICETTLCSHPLQKCVNKNGEVTCECPLICPAIYAPVCGSDGKTYPSNCSLSVEGCRKSQNIKVVSQGPCPENLSVEPDPCSISLCSHPQHTCQNINNTAVCKCREVMTLELDPKCASDGKTYANRMSMENAGCKKNMILKVVKNGRCDAVTRAGTCPAPWTGLNGLCNRRGSMCDGDSDCAGASKCCYNGCQRDCVNVADNIKCDEVCGENEQCVGFPGGSTRCLCRNNTVMNMDGTCTSVINKTDIAKPIDPCEISLCSFPHSKCRVVNDTATCECPKYCTRELVPVCGSDGKTYDNMCLLEVEACKPENTDKLLLKHQGDCKKPHDICETTLCSHPLQKCVNKNGEVTCECPLICPAIYAPVCGSDGKTYPSNCSLSVEGCRKSQNIKVVSQGPCPENLSVEPDPCSISLCSHPQHTCHNINNTAVCKCREVTTLELDPKCASDGKTYANRMSMENAGCKKNMILKVVKNGRCDAVTRAGTCPAPWTGLNGLCNRRGSMCDGDSDCAGASKCCYNGCQRDCVNVADNIKCDEVCGENEQCVGFRDGSTRCLCRNNTVMNMDGTCTSEVNECKTERADCDEHADCINTHGSYECRCIAGYTGDGKTCTAAGKPAPPPRSKPGSCPPTDPRPCPPIAMPGGCRTDMECPGQSKCCHDGCSRICSLPFVPPGRPTTPPRQKPRIKPGVCPKPWKGLDGICDRRGDMCSVDNDCNGDTKCCHNGCQKECVSPKAAPSNKTFNPCDISLCAFPTINCVVVNNTATCECPKGCTREYRPVCGTDGKTYGNMCTLAAAACKPENKGVLKRAHNGACSAGRPSPPPVKPGSCPPSDPRPCPPIARPGGCSIDMQCPGQSKCCHDGCSRICSLPFVPRGCPIIKTPKACLTKYDRKEYCKTDSNCPRGQKCCFDGCIKRCDFFTKPRPPGTMPGGNHGGAPGGNISPPGSHPGEGMERSQG